MDRFDSLLDEENLASSAFNMGRNWRELRLSHWKKIFRGGGIGLTAKEKVELVKI